MHQLKEWLLDGRVKKLCLVVKGVESKKTLERWIFNCQATIDTIMNESHDGKNTSVIQKDIQAIMRQITSSVTFLPLLVEPACFDLLVYTDKDATGM
jgi:mitotic spindle assembly checkpoint protein MAD2